MANTPIVSQPALLDVLTQLSVSADYDVEDFVAHSDIWGVRLVGPGWATVRKFCRDFPPLAIAVCGMLRVIGECFARSGYKIGWISAKDLTTQIENNRRISVDVASAHEKMIARFLENSGFVKQTFLVAYICQVCLAEDPTSVLMSYQVQPEKLVGFGQFQKDRCLMFLLAKSVVDLLDRGPEVPHV